MLDSLHIKNFRCFEDLQIESLGRVNLIVGKNNTGKSTLLEAVYLFAQRGLPDTVKSILTERNEGFGTKQRYVKNIINKELSFANKVICSIGDIKSNKAIAYTNEDDVALEIYLGGNLLTSSALSKLEEADPADLYEPYHPFNSALIRTSIQNDDQMSESWDEIRINKRTNLAKEALQIIDANIEDVFYTSKKITMATLTNEKTARPIKSLGEGMSRVLQIFLYAFQAKSGYLMIDEIENGLHYSIQQEVWEKLFKLAEELDIQVFATTHSQDTIKSFCKVALKSEQEGRLISLGRNTRGAEKGKITALTYDETDIKLIAETGMEVR